jgi:hypothetical protein
MVLKRKTHLAVEDVFPKTAFEKTFSKRKFAGTSARI